MGSATGRALLDGKVVHIADVQADSEYTFAEAQKLGGFRTILSLPMLREGVPIGVLALIRREVRPFTDKQIELVSTFADQAAIAIENVRLFESVEARTRELGKSLEDLRTAQDRLVQTEKLASLGQLTAGIAHEIKNPLNFVNNFSAVWVELIDELREALGGAHLGGKLREEISEITDTLQGNLEKIVQHGKRADLIVKNMMPGSVVEILVTVLNFPTNERSNARAVPGASVRQANSAVSPPSSRVTDLRFGVARRPRTWDTGPCGVAGGLA